MKDLSRDFINELVNYKKQKILFIDLTKISMEL